MKGGNEYNSSSPLKTSRGLGLGSWGNSGSLGSSGEPNELILRGKKSVTYPPGYCPPYTIFGYSPKIPEKMRAEGVDGAAA